jgi:hypothetical protein
MTAAAITKSDVHATSLSAGTELDARRRSGHGPGRRAHGLGEAQGGLVAVARQAGPYPVWKALKRVEDQA